MLVCNLVQHYTQTSGGIRTYVRAKRDHVVRKTPHRHLLLRPGEHDGHQIDGPLTTCEVGAPVVPGRAPYRYVRRLDKVTAILARERPDVIELGSPYLLPWAGLRHRRLYPCAVVGHYHTDFPIAYVEAPLARHAGRRLAGCARRAAERYARSLYEQCDVTIASSRNFISRLQDMGIRRTLLVPLGVDAETYHPSRRDEGVRRAWGVCDGETVFIYCGRLDNEKCVRLLVESFETLPPAAPARLVLVGDGPLLPWLQRKAHRENRLVLAPHVTEPHRLATLLASADVYVTAGPHETFGLSVVEAQASGLPVLGVSAGALMERVRPGTGLLAVPNSRDDLAGLYREALAGGVAGMGVAARQMVERDYDWTRTFDRLFRLYRDLAP